MNAEQNARTIKLLAQQEGFDFCGIAKAEFLEEEAPRLEQWLKAGNQGAMSYMERYFDLRLDPTKLVPGAKSVITLLYNYFPKQPLPEHNNYHIAKYAYGEDYHHVIKDKLKKLQQAINQQIGTVTGRAFVDSAPVMERAWAQRSGLGWIGKNSLLLNRALGSFFFIAELIVDLELAADAPTGDYCGTCTRCLDACPTDAITPYQVDGSKCISYFTIELRDAIPEEVKGQFEDWMFGCDICQDVCPWNRFASPHQEPAFSPHPRLFDFTKADWEQLDQPQFQEIFIRSAVKRTKFKGLKRNIEFIKKPR